MTQVRSTLVRFCLFAVPLAFCVSLMGCDSGDAGKKVTIDTESTPKVPSTPTTTKVEAINPGAK